VTGAPAADALHLAVLQACGLVRSGQIVDLSMPISDKAPRLSVLSPYVMCLWQHPYQSWRSRAAEGVTNGTGFADERVEMDLHTGTHIDALGHGWQHGRGFGGITLEEAVGAQGLRSLGVEHVPPMIARGVLLDVAAVRGRSLEAGEVVTVDDLKRAAAATGAGVRSGDIVLIRTGYGRLYIEDPDRYGAAWPGIGKEAAPWLTSKGVLAVGADNMALEVHPEERSDESMPVHMHMLVETGTYIIEQANLDPLAALAPSEFLCLCLPLLFVGATASPIRLLAVL
jgi:kynurenine formamidase